jgi:Uma2 family endonuclease
MTTTETTTHAPPAIHLPPDAPLAEPQRVPRPGRPWTTADLRGLADDERRFELVQGDLFVMSPASTTHGHYAALLTAALVIYIQEKKLGRVFTAEAGFKLQSTPTETVRAPDVAFVRAERIPPQAEQHGFWPLAPDLVVEIISPSETAAEVQAKVQDYLAAGTRLLWLVYPRTQTVLVYAAGGHIRQYGIDESLDGGEVLPGFAYALRLLFT